MGPCSSHIFIIGALVSRFVSAHNNKTSNAARWADKTSRRQRKGPPYSTVASFCESKQVTYAAIRFASLAPMFVCINSPAGKLNRCIAARCRMCSSKQILLGWWRWAAARCHITRNTAASPDARCQSMWPAIWSSRQETATRQWAGAGSNSVRLVRRSDPEAWLFPAALHAHVHDARAVVNPPANAPSLTMEDPGARVVGHKAQDEVRVGLQCGGTQGVRVLAALCAPQWPQ